MLSKEKTMEAIEIMYEMFPNAECELKHKNPFEFKCTSNRCIGK